MAADRYGPGDEGDGDCVEHRVSGRQVDQMIGRQLRGRLEVTLQRCRTRKTQQHLKIIIALHLDERAFHPDEKLRRYTVRHNDIHVLSLLVSWLTSVKSSSQLLYMQTYHKLEYYLYVIY